jgi:signal transduction histidine kinase
MQPEISTGLFRVVQELLSNVARHAQATRVTVSLLESDQTIVLEVADNGRGIREDELRDPNSMGLLGMSERASLMGGTIQITGTPGRGTKAVLTIPAKPA